MIKTPLCTVVGGGNFWTPDAMVLGSSFDPTSLFKSGDVGVWLDATDLNTMRSDHIGQTVTALTQLPIFVFDKSKKLAETVDTIANLDFSSGFTGWTNGTNYWTLDVNKFANHALSSVLNPLATPALNDNLKFKRISFECIITSGGLSYDLLSISGSGVGTSDPISNGTFNAIIGRDVNKLQVKRTPSNTTSAKVGNFKVSTIAGNHSVQRTTSKRPVLQANGVIFDGVDDELPITFDSALSNCTIIRAFNGTVTISTGQAVAITHNITQSYNQYLVINRALTALEQAQITSHFKQKMGSI